MHPHNILISLFLLRLSIKQLWRKDIKVITSLKDYQNYSVGSFTFNELFLQTLTFRLHSLPVRIILSLMVLEKYPEFLSSPLLFQKIVRYLKLASTLFPLLSTLEYILPCPDNRGIALPEVMEVLSYLDFNFLIVISLTSMPPCLRYTWLISLFLKVQELPLPSLPKAVFYFHSYSLIQKYKSQCLFLNYPFLCSSSYSVYSVPPW